MLLRPEVQETLDKAVEKNPQAQEYLDTIEDMAHYVDNYLQNLEDHEEYQHLADILRQQGIHDAADIIQDYARAAREESTEPQESALPNGRLQQRA